MRVQWKKLLQSEECNGTISIALLENGTFYLISCNQNQPIKRPEFNEVLYDINYLLTAKFSFSLICSLRLSGQG